MCVLNLTLVLATVASSLLSPFLRQSFFSPSDFQHFPPDLPNCLPPRLQNPKWPPIHFNKVIFRSADTEEVFDFQSGSGVAFHHTSDTHTIFLANQKDPGRHSQSARRSILWSQNFNNLLISSFLLDFDNRKICFGNKSLSFWQPF